MIKGSFQEEGITIVNIYAPNIGAPQYISQALTNIKGEIDSNTIIVGDFNIPFTTRVVFVQWLIHIQLFETLGLQHTSFPCP